MKTNEKTWNTTALQKRILIQYESLNEFAAKMGINVEKLEGKEEFVLADIQSITNEFNLSEKEAMAYFFPEMEPEEPKYAMVNVLAMERIIRKLERIEDGLTALDMMTTGQIREVGDTITNEDFQNAFSFIMNEIMDKVTDLRADLNGKYFKEYDRIGKAG